MRPLRNYGALIACAAAIALVALPATATAKRNEVVLSDSALTGFTLKGSNGYSIQVLTIGRRLMLLGASKGQVFASYAVKGRISRDRIEARFGNLGRVSVRFSGSPLTRRERSHRCEGLSDLVKRGTFRGTIKFSGEQGYTEVDANRARGIVFGSTESACTIGKAAPSAGFSLPGFTTHLTAVAKRAGKAYTLDASEFGGGHRILLSASIQERRAKMQIFRAASATVGGKNAFVSSDVGEHPAHATLKPPKPFSGTGVFQETSPVSNSWSGSIAAWLPGAGKVSMAGPAFASSFCKKSLRGAGCSLFPTVQRDLQATQDKGSQSQALREVMLSWSRYLRNSSSSDGSTP